MKLFKLPLAVAAVMALLLIATPAGAHTTNWWTSEDPTGGAGNPANTDSTAHLHWSDKTDWLKVELPIDAVMNQDEDASTGGDGATDPADGDVVGQAVVATNFSSDFDCSTGDDLQDGGTYDIKWEDSWTSYTPPNGWTKVAEYKTVVLFVNIPTHVIVNDTTGQNATDTDLPTTLTCSGTPTNMQIKMKDYVGGNSSNPWIGKNPTTTGNYDVCATATLTTGVQHTDCDGITV